MRALQVALAAVILFAALPAQDVPDATDFRLHFDVNLVQVDAVVTDSKGHHVPNLKASDFEVFQDGKPQKITHFTYVAGDREAAATASPDAQNRQVERGGARRTFLIFIDDIAQSFGDYSQMRRDLLKFVDQDVRPGDLWAIYKTSGGSGAWQTFSSSRDEIRSAVEHMNWLPQPTIFRVRHFDMFLRQVNLAMAELGRLPGRKVLVFVNGGVRVDEESEFTARPLAEAANRASVSVYSLDYRGLRVGSGMPDNWADASHATPLSRGGGATRQARYVSSMGLPEELATQTGGLFLHDRNGFADEMREISEDNAGYYLIGWHPGPDIFGEKSPRYHKLKITVDMPGVKVRTRAGFGNYPSGDATRPLSTAAARMEEALFSPFRSGAIDVSLSASFQHDDAFGPYIQSLVHVAPRGIRFEPAAGGCYSANLELLTSPQSLTPDAVQRDRSNSQMTTLQACGATAQTIMRDGLVYVLRNKVERPGPYEMRIAVRNVAPGERSSLAPKALVPRGDNEPEHAEIGSAAQFVEVPDLRKGELALSGITLSAHGVKVTAGVDAPSGNNAIQTIYRAPLPGDPAVRSFNKGDALDYATEIFRGNKGDQALRVELKILHEGQPVHTETLTVDGERVHGQYRPDAGSPAGSYVMEIVATENPDKRNPVAISRWLDFQLVDAQVVGGN